MNSCIYVGQVRHRRFTPKQHRFNYRLFMVYLDLDELTKVFEHFWFWSTKGFNLAWFKREDHYGDPKIPLSDAIRNFVAQETGRRPKGPVRLLTHLRYFGHGFSPVNFYYCFASDGETLEQIVAEVNNTPWGEQHLYVLPVPEQPKPNDLIRCQQSKVFHVSPFMPMDLQYHWRLSIPDEQLNVHIENHQQKHKVFDATLSLKKETINSINLAKVLILYPLITLKVVGAIYFEAMRLWIKKIPFVPHPNEQEAPETVKKP